ncbi:MAG: type II secretion system F family protein [Candidatus Omnitrophica bacterium]|nr:type II secretion system F family protein [Candidatus Omnitrophota bacterium]
MPHFAFSARDEKGELIHGDAEAGAPEDLARSLQTKGLTVVSIEEKKKAARMAKGKRRLHKGAKIGDLIIFARQLAILLDSGVPILRAISVLGQQVESTALLGACLQIEEDLKAGSSLRDAVAKHPKIFSQMWRDLIETGEATGQLSPVLKRLADYLDEIWELQKKVVSAMVYPAVLICVAIGAILVFMYRVIPIFAGIYKGFGKLPLLTQIVIDASNGLSKNFFNLMAGGAIAVFLFRRYVRTEKGTRWFDALKLKIPVAGGLFLSMAIERFTTALGMMLKGGISIIHALDTAIKSSSNKVVEGALEKVKASVLQGRSISLPMVETGIFPPLVTQMISVGEESGRLPQLLDEVSKYYTQDISTKVTRLVALFEPAILVVMGGVIGILVTAMYLPIFTMASAVGGG